MTSTSTPERDCQSCGTTCPPSANWCEACGADLDAPLAAAKKPCVSCAAAAVEITDDGWCQLCGHKQPAPEDHVEADHGWFAMVSDIGSVHRTNEDAGAVSARPNGVALVVCDGVSSTDESQHAAQAAARTVAETIEKAAASLVDRALVEGAHKAQAAIVDLTGVGVAEPPSCTMVAMVADMHEAQATLRFGWLGDSRAYWITSDAAVQLTRDHSWAIEQHDLGELTAAEIAEDARAHSITRWLGADSHDISPELAAAEVALPGSVLLCSDGLWNYADTEQAIFDLFNAGPVDESPLARAQRLVEFANNQGGHDNITVALASLDIRSTHG